MYVFKHCLPTFSLVYREGHQHACDDLARTHADLPFGMQLLAISVHITQRSIEMYVAVLSSTASEHLFQAPACILRVPGSADINTVYVYLLLHLLSWA